MGMLQDMTGQMGGAQPAEGGMDAQALIKQATELLYGENFEAMVQMFQQYGKEGFPDAMATAINGVLDRLEKETGQPLDASTAAEVGVALFEILLGDLSEGGVLPDIDKQDVLKAVEKTLAMWAKAHPDQTNPEEMKAAIEQMAQQMAQAGALEGGQVMTPEEAEAAGAQPQQGQPPQGV